MRAIILFLIVFAAAAGPEWGAGEIETLRELWIGSLPPLEPDPSNRYADDPRAASLGYKLFFDTRLSAAEKRILVTHDVNTVPRFAYERVDAGQPMPGVFAVPSDAAIGEIVDDRILLALTREEGEWEGRVPYLPLR